MSKVKTAYRMNAYFCDCGCGILQVELIDDKGKIFAEANLPFDVAIDMAFDILDDADELSEYGDATVPAGNC